MQREVFSARWTIEPGASAPGEFIDLFGEFLDLLSFFDQGDRERGIRIGSLNLLFEFGGHFVDSSDIFSDLLLALRVNDSFILDAWVVRAWWTFLVPLGVGPRFTGRPWQLQTEEMRIGGQNSESTSQSQ